MKWTKEQTLGIFLLWIVTVCISSAATGFDFIDIPNPFLKAFWRLQITTVICALISIRDWKNRRSDCIAMWWQSWHWVILSGIWLGLHFWAGTLSLQLTSLAHVLLFVCSGSIIVILISLIRWKWVKLITILGTGIGFAGIVVTAFAPFENISGDVAGDFVALLGALFMVTYLQIGENMRKVQDIPLLPYLTGVNGIAWLTCYIAAVIKVPSNASLIVQYLYTNDIYPVLYLGAVPGILGHALLNYLLKIMSPLLTLVFMNSEPIIGSLIGYAFGFQGEPTQWTLIGGIMIITANVMVTITEFKPPKEDLGETGTIEMEPLQNENKD